MHDGTRQVSAPAVAHSWPSALADCKLMAMMTVGVGMLQCCGGHKYDLCGQVPVLGIQQIAAEYIYFFGVLCPHLPLICSTFFLLLRVRYQHAQGG